ncbi:MAG: PepSY domain-containing protein [Candidatus Sericytochromatia bacterium]
MKRFKRLLHKWLGVSSFLFIIIVSLTAIGLNHPEIIFYLKGKQNINIETQINLKKTKFFAIAPNNDKEIIASDLRGLFKSLDAGKTWKELKLFVPSEKIDLITISPKNDDLIAVGMKDKGIFISDDGGEVWEEILLPFSPPAENIQNISFNAKKLLVKTENGFYKYNYLEDQKWENLKFSENYQETLNIKELVYNLHTGKFFGSYGIFLYDLLSISMILLSISGLMISFKFRLNRGK